MSNLALTIRESLRYRGRSGHWSWIAHRLSGLAILLFLTIHVWDTATAFYSPNLYRWFVDVFKWPPIAVGEVALMAAVLYHAFNGIRISILDYKPYCFIFTRATSNYLPLYYPLWIHFGFTRVTVHS